MTNVQEIEAAIRRLGPQELEELLAWLDQFSGPQPIDLRIEADAVAGRLDKLMQEAADDYRSERTRAL
jgi:DNA replication protein DnaD